jgi:hypothetical protein
VLWFLFFVFVFCSVASVCLFWLCNYHLCCSDHTLQNDCFIQFNCNTIIIIIIFFFFFFYVKKNPLQGNSLLMYAFTSFCDTRNFITVYTKARNWTLSCLSTNQPTNSTFTCSVLSLTLSLGTQQTLTWVRNNSLIHCNTRHVATLDVIVQQPHIQFHLHIMKAFSI